MAKVTAAEIPLLRMLTKSIPVTRSGRTFDVTGIPPHLTEPVFTTEEFDKMRDSAFDRAVVVLRNYGGTTSCRRSSGTGDNAQQSNTRARQYQSRCSAR
jgi:hypothetical protein